MNRYPVPADLVRTEEVIKRSRFITTLARAATVDEAKELIELVRDEFADATHNCWPTWSGRRAAPRRWG